MSRLPSSAYRWFRLEAIVLHFVLVFENILAAVFVRELLPDESDEIAEVLALGPHGPSGSVTGVEEEREVEVD
jgi:hypothetical protein